MRKLLAGMVGVIATAVTAIGLTVWMMYSNANEYAKRDARNLATILAQHTERAVHGIDRVLIELQDQIAASSVGTADPLPRAALTPEFHELLKRNLKRLPQAYVIALLDQDGQLVNSSQDLGDRRVWLADRDYFQYWTQHHEAGLFVSVPAVGRVTGAQMLFLSRRLDRPDGSLLGVIMVGVETGYFQRVYEAIRSIQDESFLFARRDGTVLIRYPHPASKAGAMIPASSVWHDMVSRGGGSYRAEGIFDGIPQLVAAQPLQDYPLVVDVSVAEPAALASWRRQAALVAGGTILILLCLTALVRALLVQFRQLSLSELGLALQTRRLKRAHARIDAAINNMSQGLCMFDSKDRLVVCNGHFVSLHGLPADLAAPGTQLRAILRYWRDAGILAGSDVQAPDSLAARIAQRKPFHAEYQLRGERIISLDYQPMAPGGWVATCEDITERHRAEAQIAYMAMHDALTGLPNRFQFGRQLAGALDEANAGQQLALLCLDLDDFKTANDSLGHPVGDELLKMVADRLRACIGPANIAARVGGDEFAVIQTTIGDRSDCVGLTERIREAVRAPFEIDVKTIALDVSIGVAVAPDDAKDATDLLNKADLALYQAKSDGRGSCVYFQPEMTVRIKALQSLEADMRMALAAGEFELHYQPIVAISSGTIVGCEALIRWRHPGRGLISPAEFIPVAQQSGFIIPLGDWILRRACIDAATWPADIKVAVNISPVQFKNERLSDVVTQTLFSTGLAPHRLELEITEEIFLQDTERTLATLHELRGLGIAIAMDDFGTGYSSLSYLRRFPFDGIKIDQSFIRDVASQEGGSLAIVKAVISIADSLDLVTTAEGVENNEQLAALRLAGCTTMQGFVFSRPLPLADLMPLLLRGRAEARSAA